MTRTKMIFATSLLVGLLLFGSSLQVNAQGAIVGLVERSDGSTPPDSSILFIGYIAQTDNELHLSGSVGAGYDQGHWFDNFPNYLFAPAGAVYTYHLFDTISLESARAESLIVADGFQEHDLTLSTGLWPEPPQGVKLSREISGAVSLSWLADPSTTIHIYRRVVPSEGSFFRIDDPAGTILATGIETGDYRDTTTASDLGYTYLLLAVNLLSGEFSPPVALQTAPADCCGLYTGGFPGNTTGGSDGKRNLADITQLVDRVYLSRNLLWCEPDGNVNGDLEQKLNLADITRLIDLIFLSKTELDPCSP